MNPKFDSNQITIVPQRVVLRIATYFPTDSHLDLNYGFSDTEKPDRARIRSGFKIIRIDSTPRFGNTPQKNMRTNEIATFGENLEVDIPVLKNF